MPGFSRKKSLFSFGETRTERRASWILFLIGLGSSTQINIGGYTAISELLLVLWLPINYFKNLALFKRDGLMPFITLLIIWMAGVCFTDLYWGNWFGAWIRGMIPPVGILAALVALYPQLKRHPDGYKWFLLGVAISGVISIFVFQHGSDVGTDAVRSGQISAVEAVVGYKLFWVGKVSEWGTLPVKGWYLSTPYLYSLLATIAIAFYSLLTGGRSSFAVGMVSAVIILIAGRKWQRMRGLKKHLPVFILVLLAFMPLVKFVYKYAATHGFMGEHEEQKYYEQSEGKNLAQTLMSGRSEFFVSLFAIKDHPLIGHGSYALDTKGYRVEFCSKYGDLKDLEGLKEAYRMNVRTIPAHSHITCYWMWAGIPGLLPWIYILSILVGTLFKRMHVVPQFYGFFAIVLPPLFWHIFFSPFGSRINMGFVMAMCFWVKMIYRNNRLRGVSA